MIDKKESEINFYRDVANCKLNIPYMQELGLNAIRVYSVDNSAYSLNDDSG